MSTFLVWQGPTGEPNNPLNRDWWVSAWKLPEIYLLVKFGDSPFLFFFFFLFGLFLSGFGSVCSVGVQGIVREAQDVSPWASRGAIDVRPVGMVHEIRFE
jgi:hypothetical protein